MKKLILMLAFVAGPILYAQQKPTAESDQKKIEVLKTEQTKTTQAKSTQAKALNLSDTKAVNRKYSTKTTVKKARNAKSLKDKMEK